MFFGKFAKLRKKFRCYFASYIIAALFPKGTPVFFLFIPTGEKDFVHDQYRKLDVPCESMVARKEMHE